VETGEEIDVFASKVSARFIMNKAVRLYWVVFTFAKAKKLIF
jgi:hypothetical protein